MRTLSIKCHALEKLFHKNKPVDDFLARFNRGVKILFIPKDTEERKRTAMLSSITGLITTKPLPYAAVF